jgi:tetratricopeptide (TPR) repeat protein
VAPDAICNRGALDDKKDLTKELDDYSRAIALDPEYDNAYHNRAILRLRLGKDLEKALEDVDRAERFGQSRPWFKEIPHLREQIKQAMQQAR